jgi:adenylate kinase
MGSPGSGKTSIGNRLSSVTDVDMIETGQLLRDEINKESAVGQKIEYYINKGKLAPTHLVVEILTKKIKKTDTSTIIFDGSPRREEEIEPFFNILEENKLVLHQVVVFNIKRDSAFKRLTGRRICSKCDAIYNVYFNPPEKEGKCDRCGGTLEQREDDKPEIVNKRMNEYDENTQPVIEYFRGCCPEKILDISAEQPIDEIVNKIKNHIIKS